jgi:hypothetical protein
MIEWGGPLLACQQCETGSSRHCRASRQWHPTLSREAASERSRGLKPRFTSNLDSESRDAATETAVAALS